MRSNFIACTFIFLVATSFNPVDAQTLKLSGEIKQFPAEAREMLKGVIAEDHQAIFNDFFKSWETDSLFLDEEKTVIMKICSRMLQLKARPAPHIHDFLLNICYFRTTGLDPESYKNWLGSVESLVQQSKVSLLKLAKLFDNTNVLLTSTLVFKSTSLEWKTGKVKFTFLKSQRPLASFDKVDLTCVAKRDSVMIHETSGIFDILDNIWIGQGGIVTWERTGYQVSEINARLGNYRIDMSKTSYTADSVMLINKRFFNHPVIGKLKDEVTLITSPENTNFPVFESYQKNFQIKSIYENMEYNGGLSMQGSKLIGSGTQQQKATLNIYRKDTLFMKVGSNFFVFRKEKLVGKNVSVVILFEQDSIYHGELDMTYMVDSKEYSFMHTENYTSNSPWFNSYHGLDMSFDRLIWKTGDPKLYFTMQRGASIGVANFESKNFFSGSKYEEIQLHDPINPLVAIRNFAKVFMYDEFPAADYAHYRGISLDAVRIDLLRLCVMGFLFYNTQTDYVKLKPKLYDYIAASIGKIDYDMISLVSTTEAPLENASLDLRNFDMEINGIPLIILSDSQNVALYPSKGHIVMKRNRSFQFDGKVVGGLFVFFGKNFFFNYNDFKINLQHIDSINVNILTGEKDNYGRAIIKQIKNSVENAKGELLIDKPDNKSGVKHIPQYPIFNSNESSYVYYDNPGIYEGVYKRDKFYFKIYPYSIDSIDNYKKEEMKFKGKFISAGILPDLEQTLTCQADYSMGFNLNTSSDGLPLYRGKGKVFDYVELSNQGLKSKGSVDYLTSTTSSEDIIFFPDSMNTLAKQYHIRQRTTVTEFPRVDGKNCYIHWLPKKDSMYACQKKEPFLIYNDTTSLTGDLTLTPSGLSGNGKMDMKVADLNSNLYVFKSLAFDADTTDFNLKSLAAGDKFTFVSKNVKSHVDFNQRKGMFKSNIDLGYVEFPDNQYISYLDYYNWKMDTRELEMGSKKKFMAEQVPATYKDIMDEDDAKLVGARYISVNKSQDSLSFMSPLATYDYKENIIRASQVKYIKVADSKIFPDQGKLEVGHKGDMKMLENAVSMANLDTRYHRIHDAHLKIEGRYSYKGSGDYDYKDETGKIQLIHFNEIGVDTTIKTFANGEIVTTQNFTLSPEYEYHGKVMLIADQKYLTFKGGVRIRHACDAIAKAWMSFDSPINPDSIYIPVQDKPLDINRNPIFNGLFLTVDSIHEYPAFLSFRKNYNDFLVHTAKGFLHYIKDSLSYVIGPADKIQNNSIPGNLLTLNRNKCRITGEGIINLGVNLGKMQISAAGNWTGDLAKNTQFFDLYMVADFPLLDKAVNFMVSDFDSLPGKGAVDLSNKKLWRSIELFIGREKTLKLKDEMSLYGAVKEMPEELIKTLVINDIKLQWNDRINAYQSIGKIGVGNIMNRKVNKYVDGYVEIVRKRSGDICDIYLKLDDKNWYYFGYTRGVMQTLSSNQKYMDAIKALSADARTIKAKTTSETSYIYMLATDTKISQFLRKYRKVLAGENVQEPDEDKQ